MKKISEELDFKINVYDRFKILHIRSILSNFRFKEY